MTYKQFLMSEELQKPPVIDFDGLFAPISEENPAGEYLRYAGVYDEISEARRADKDVAQGDWQTTLKTADFRQVIALCTSALTSRTKDLQIAAWFSEALVKEYGFAGLRDSLKLLSGLQEQFWESLHPEIEDGDEEGRANAIAWVDTQTSLAARGAALVSGAGYGINDWEDSKRFDIPENLDTLDSAEQERYRDLQTQAENEHRTTGDLWRKAKSGTSRTFCEATNFLIAECWTEFNELNRVIEEKYDRNQMPGLSALKKTLEDVEAAAKKLLDEKRLEEPRNEDVESVAGADETADGADNGAVISGGRAVASGAINSRQDALKRLSDVAVFFQRTEPHSPVSYLVNRAVKWGNMPLDGWLRDVIKDENVLFQLRQTLGMDANEAESSDY